ncbi:MAG: response regulator receiver protein [Chloroflexi bacterium]|nr:response regulator receiver protein [Chloroflexota bacterium]
MSRVDDDAPVRPVDPTRDVEQMLRYAEELAGFWRETRGLSRRLAAAGRQDPPKLLIADDEVSLRMLVIATLAGEDYTVLQANTGPAAWAVAQEERPRLVLLDLSMPGMSGIEVCRLIRADPDLRSTHVVMLTGSQLSADQEAGLAAGADAFLTKPFRPLELLRVTERWMAMPERSET